MERVLRFTSFSGSVVNYCLIPGWWKQSEQLKGQSGMQGEMEMLELTWLSSLPLALGST